MSEKKKVPLDHLRSKKKPVTRTVRIATDQEVAERYHKAKQKEALLALDFKERPHSEAIRDEYEQAKAELAEATDALRENSIKFVFRSIGRRRLRELEEAFPITDEQRKEAIAANNGEDPGVNWNPDTFPDQLVAHALVEPELSPEEMLEWLGGEEWNGAETQALFEAAWGANAMRAVADLGKDSGTIGS